MFNSFEGINLAVATLGVLSGSPQLALLLTIGNSVLQTIRILMYGKSINDNKLAPSSDIALVIGAMILAIKNNAMAATKRVLILQSFKLLGHCINNKDNFEIMYSGLDTAKKWLFGQKAPADFVFPKNVKITDAVVEAIKKEYLARKYVYEYFQSENTKKVLKALDKYKDLDMRHHILEQYLADPSNKKCTFYHAAAAQLQLLSITGAHDSQNSNSLPKTEFFVKKYTLRNSYSSVQQDTSSLETKADDDIKTKFDLKSSDKKEENEDSSNIKQNNNIGLLKR